jgi:hypothetical protein
VLVVADGGATVLDVAVEFGGTDEEVEVVLDDVDGLDVPLVLAVVVLAGATVLVVLRLRSI